MSCVRSAYVMEGLYDRYGSMTVMVCKCSEERRSVIERYMEEDKFY